MYLLSWLQARTRFDLIGKRGGVGSNPNPNPSREGWKVGGIGGNNLNDIPQGERMNNQIDIPLVNSAGSTARPLAVTSDVAQISAQQVRKYVYSRAQPHARTCTEQRYQPWFLLLFVGFLAAVFGLPSPTTTPTKPPPTTSSSATGSPAVPSRKRSS